MTAMTAEVTMSPSTAGATMQKHEELVSNSVSTAATAAATTTTRISDMSLDMNKITTSRGSVRKSATKKNSIGGSNNRRSNGSSSSPSSSSSKKKTKKQQQQAPKSFHLYDKPKSLDEKRCDRIVKYARKRLRGSGDNGDVLNNAVATTRVLSHSQVDLGKLLGKGAFSSVYSIRSIQDQEDETTTTTVDTIVVKFLRTKLYDNHGLFAASAADLVKEGNILSRLNHRNVIQLHAVSHVDGVGAYLSGYHDSYFLVLERLEGTLSDRIVEWKTRHASLYDAYRTEIVDLYNRRRNIAADSNRDNSNTIVINTTNPAASSSGASSSPGWRKRIFNRKRMSINNLRTLSISSSSNNKDAANATEDEDSSSSSYDGDDEEGYYTANDDDQDQSLTMTTSPTASKLNDLLKERLDVVTQLADAIAYLHSQNVVHRDLKPDNIGFDSNGTLKVFDFDIGRVMPTIAKDENELFRMTQKVGSPRYMSPECAKKEPYNMKTDVYSFGLLAHQLLTLQKPYDDIDDDDHDRLVFHDHVRPYIPEELPTKFRQLLFRSWAPVVSFRPNMKRFAELLKEQSPSILVAGSSVVKIQNIIEDDDDDIAEVAASVSTVSYINSALAMYDAITDCNMTNRRKKEMRKLQTKKFAADVNVSMHNNHRGSTRTSNAGKSSSSSMNPLSTFRKLMNFGDNHEKHGGKNGRNSNMVVAAPPPTRNDALPRRSSHSAMAA